MESLTGVHIQTHRTQEPFHHLLKTGGPRRNGGKEVWIYGCMGDFLYK